MTVDPQKIFCSYARVDTEFVLKLANDLRSAGVRLWIDQLDIPPGDRWDSAVENALMASSCLLVVLSPASVISQNVLDEIAFALENKKKIVPVLHSRCAIPFRIQRLQYIDFTATYNHGFAQLLRTLNDLQPSQMSQALVPASQVSTAASGVAHSEPRRRPQRLIYVAWRLFVSCYTWHQLLDYSASYPSLTSVHAGARHITGAEGSITPNPGRRFSGACWR